MNTTQEIQDIIRKNLPAHVGDELRKELDELAKARAEIPSLNKRVEDYKSHSADLQRQLDAHRRLGDREVEVGKRESAVGAREQKCAIEEALKAEREQRVADLKEVTLAVFANAKLKYTETHTVPIARSYGAQSGDTIEHHTHTNTGQREA